MWSFLKCHTLDVWDWICGNTYPRQEKLDLLAATKIDTAANSTVDKQANVTANAKANIIANTKVKLTDPIAAMESDWNDYLKKSSDNVEVELRGLASDAIDPRSPRPERRIVKLIRQPSFLCWTETHPQGSMCATSYVRGHQEF